MRPKKLNRDGVTCVVPIDVYVFGIEWKLVGILNDVFIELIIKEGVRIFLPGDSFK